MKKGQHKLLLSFGLIWSAYAALALRFWFVVDDAFISFRYARNLAQGLGLRYNLGEHIPVEGYSSFLWVVICAVIEYLRLDVTFWAPFFSFLCGGLLLWRVHNVLIRVFELNHAVTLLATLSLACFPPFAVWSTSGLATMPFALVLFYTFEQLVLSDEQAAPLKAGISGLVLALIRTEGIAWVIVLGICAVISRVLASRKVRQPLLTYFAIVMAGFSVYFLWRWSYFQTPFANTVYAKVAAGGGLDVRALLLMRGFNYVAVFFLTFLTPFVTLLASLAALHKKWRASGVSIIMLSLAVICFPILVGGDFMTMGRFLVPGFAFNVLVFAFFLQILWRRWEKFRPITALVAFSITIIGLLPAFNVHLVPHRIRSQFHFRFNTTQHRTEYEQWHVMRSRSQKWKQKGLALKEYAAPDESLVASAIGNLGYYSELFIYDKAGLITPEAARLPTKVPLRSPGHDKGASTEFFLNRQPTYIYVKLHSINANPKLKELFSRLTDRLKLEEYSTEYAPDFVILNNKQEGQDNRILLVLRHVKDKDKVDEAWKRFQDKLSSAPF